MLDALCFAFIGAVIFMRLNHITGLLSVLSQGQEQSLPPENLMKDNLMTTNTESATPSDIATGLANIIDNAIGASESPAVKSRLHLVANILGSLGTGLVPLLASKYDVQALLSAINRTENGIAEIEAGLHDAMNALSAPKAKSNNSLSQSA